MEDHVYACFGLNIRSQIPLPEIQDAAEPDDLLPRVVLRLGEAGQWTGGEAAPRFEVSDLGVIFSVANAAQYRVANGDEIVVTPAPGAAMRDVLGVMLTFDTLRKASAGGAIAEDPGACAAPPIPGDQ